MAAHKTPGPDISAGALAARARASWRPAPTPRPTRSSRRPIPGPTGNPQPVHTAAAHRERRLPHGEPRPRGAGPPARSTSSCSSPCPSRSAAPRGRWSTPWPSSEGGPSCPATMEALVVLEPNRFEIQEVPIPVPGPERGAGARAGGLDLRHRRPPRPRRLPGLLAAGVPVHPGPRVGRRDRRPSGRGSELYGWKVGDRVAGTSHDACGVCQKCVEGRYNLCENYGRPGLHKQYGHSVQGADATYVVQGVKTIFPLPGRPLLRRGRGHRPGLDRPPRRQPRQHRARATPWRSPAPVRSACSAATPPGSAGAARVILIERNAGRLAKAAAMGFETVDASVGDPVATVREMTGGFGVDVVLECAGVPVTVQWALGMLRRGGRCAAVGIPTLGVEIAMQRLVLDELELVGSRATAGEMRRVMPLVEQGRMRVRDVMTHRFALADYPAGARDLQRPRERGHQDHRRALTAGRAPPRAAGRTGAPGEPPRDLRLRLRPAPRPDLRGGQGASSAARPPTSTVMAVDLGLPVPPAFTITTAPATSTSRAAGRTASTTSCAHHMARIEQRVGRRFGDPGDPLLVSVRSGAPISMPGMMDTILNLGLNDATTGGPRRPLREPEVRRQLPRAASRRCTATSSASRPSPRTRGRSCGRPSRPSSGPGTATGRARTASARGSPTTSARRSPSRPWSSATAASTPGPACSSPATRPPASPSCTATSCSTPRARTSSPGTHRTEPIAVLDERMPEVARELREYAARLERHHADLLRHRVHDRARPALDAPVPDRQAEPAGGPPDRGRHGRGPGLPADAPGGRPRGWPGSSPTRRVVTTERRDAGPALATGLPASPGVACGEIVTSPDAAVEAAEAGRTVDPRPRRDVARRRPRHGPRRRHPHLDRRAREPRRRRRARVGDPGRRRRGRRSSSATRAWSSVAPHARRRGDDHDRRQHRRGLRRRGGRRRDGRARGGHAARLGPRARASRSATAAAGRARPRRRPRRRARAEARRPNATQPRPPAPTPTTSLRALTVKGYATPEGDRDRAPLHGRRGQRASSTGSSADGLAEMAAGSFRLTRRRQGRRAGADRRRRRALGRRPAPPPRSTRSSPSTTG